MLEEKFLEIIGDEFFFTIINSVVIVDLGKVSIANRNFPSCELCWNNFTDGGDELNSIPDCSKCGRSRKTGINFQTGNGDGVYTIFGLAPNKQNEGVPLFEGAVLDFRQDQCINYLNELNGSDGIFPLNLKEANVLSGQAILNLGSIQVNDKIYISDIVATSNSEHRFPVVCDLNMVKGEYKLFGILDQINGQPGKVIKSLVVLLSKHSGELDKQLPYSEKAVRDFNLSIKDSPVFYLTGDHHSQCFAINFSIAHNWSRVDDSLSWLVAGDEAKIEEVQMLYREMVPNGLRPEVRRRVLELRLPK